MNGDGCSSTCEIETGWTCTGADWFQHDICNEICGDGLNLEFHECDDGNFELGDGCNDECVVETGWYCSNGTGTNADSCWYITPTIDNFTLSTNNSLFTFWTNHSMLITEDFYAGDWLVEAVGP